MTLGFIWEWIFFSSTADIQWSQEVHFGCLVPPGGQYLSRLAHTPLSLSLSVFLSWRRCCLKLCSERRRAGRCPSCSASWTVIRWGKLSVSGRGRSSANYERETRRYSERGWRCCNMLKRYLTLYIHCVIIQKILFLLYFCTVLHGLWVHKGNKIISLISCENV